MSELTGMSEERDHKGMTVRKRVFDGNTTFRLASGGPKTVVLGPFGSYWLGMDEQKAVSVSDGIARYKSADVDRFPELETALDWLVEGESDV